MENITLPCLKIVYDLVKPGLSTPQNQVGNCSLVLISTRVWTGGQWVQWETRPLHVQGNPLHLRKFPLHFQTCLKGGFKTSPAILLSKFFYGNFSKKSSSFLAKFWKTQKIKYFVEKGFKLWHKMFMKAKPRLSYCFCKVKCAKSQQFSFAGGFAGTPSLAVGLFYTCILQGARQVQGPCCTNPSVTTGLVTGML